MLFEKNYTHCFIGLPYDICFASFYVMEKKKWKTLDKAVIAISANNSDSEWVDKCLYIQS